MVRKFKQSVYGSICIIVLTSCATFKTLDEHLPLYERIFIYSGTRLDWAAIAKNDAALSKFKATPPYYPLVDLPLSFALDSLFLPLTVSAEIFH
ncbi:MAG: YceK/YidQ family lipoprotein [Gammaproteobacteria bacterium]